MTYKVYCAERERSPRTLVVEVGSPPLLAGRPPRRDGQAQAAVQKVLQAPREDAGALPPRVLPRRPGLAAHVALQVSAVAVGPQALGGGVGRGTARVSLGPRTRVRVRVQEEGRAGRERPEILPRRPTPGGFVAEEVEEAPLAVTLGGVIACVITRRVSIAPFSLIREVPFYSGSSTCRGQTVCESSLLDEIPRF